MNNIDPKALIRVYQILVESMLMCGRTVGDVCIYANYDSRNIFYKVLKGICRPEVNVKIAIGANVPLPLLHEYLECLNIQLSTRYSEENRIFWDYIESHQTHSGARYDLNDLNDLLEMNGYSRL